MKKSLCILLLTLIAGCLTPPQPTSYETWLSELTEGQALTIRSAAIAADVFNETYDHTIKEFRENPALTTDITGKVNEARRLYRQAKSWDLTSLPHPPERLTLSGLDRRTVDAPRVPIIVDYLSYSTHPGRKVFALTVETRRGKKAMSWSNGTEPVWLEPFRTIVDGDAVVLDIPDLIQHIKVERE